MDTRKNNKVLSVSYGHFSCSVEGFDDSFEVMTSVVEFFRNLAQEDRYFGAEPVKLTPDLIAELSKKTQTSNIEVTQDADNLTVRKSSPTQMAPVATSAAFALNERLKRLRAAETDMSDNADSDGETDLVEIVADPKPQTIDPKPTKSETTTSVTAASDDTETVPTQPQGLTQPDTAPTDISAADAELEIEHSPAADGDMPAETAADDSARADTDPQTIDVAADDTTDTAAQEPQEATISLRQAPEPDKMEITPKRPERTSKRITRNAENLERPSTDMVRLLKAAKEQMDEPETHRKRNALEHLRAAVAATLADNSILSRDKSKRERDDTSEDNIAPKRPAKSKSAATGVPVTPLVLQMDQRVDMDKSGSSTPEADSA